MDNIKGLVKEVNQITAEFGSPEIKMSLGALAPSVHQKWGEEAYQKYRNWDKDELQSEIVKLTRIVEIREKEFAEEIKKGWVGDFGPSQDTLEGARRALAEIEGATIVTCPKCGSVLEISCYPSPVAMIYPPPAPATIPAVCPICRAEVYSEKGYSCRVTKVIERGEAPTPPAPYVPPVPVITPTLPAKIASKLKDYLPYVALAGIGSLAIYFLITAIKPKKTARGKYIEKYLKERRI